MADERREIDGDPGLTDRRQRFADIERRTAAVAGDDGRDAHAHEVFRARRAGDAVGVGVDVDEPGRHDEARGVDRLRGAVARQDPDGRDSAVLDRDIGAPRRCSRSIDQRAAGDHQVVARRLRDPGRGQEGSEQGDADGCEAGTNKGEPTHDSSPEVGKTLERGHWAGV